MNGPLLAVGNVCRPKIVCTHEWTHVPADDFTPRATAGIVHERCDDNIGKAPVGIDFRSLASFDGFGVGGTMGLYIFHSS